ncbi:MAG: 2-C-methyl-D-erythritol 4-phosphate cytidylyltransferase [Candidatus Amulumruptor caecigallinarius]|nr:2-C-methyl-D-erythritol 4-phosphate cytidylyltransferase [Candidatus Amulumruptor caecigallinarius]MCM1397745.1 2-C-methyl-D-erythritol 4-phosphate cytidylyltransferase [Candidatus Amulumruptor caecigallinarius]MCM1453180.1 2-C-methyl-D-erythritol 4-phosphate cytidylyltransferase [bacterium]
MSGHEPIDYSRLHIIVVAAGVGARFGAAMPKQFQPLGGRPLLMTTITRLRETAPSAQLTLVLSREMEELWRELCVKHSFVSPPLAYGGASRAESVSNALEAVSAEVQMVAVHDGVRPFVTPEMLDEAVKAVMEGADGAIPVVPVTDSLRLLGTDGTSVPVDRSNYRAVQTPQVFRADRLIAAYARGVRPEFTDDASVMAAAGFTDIRLTTGSPYNIKLTNPLDLIILEALASRGVSC